MCNRATTRTLALVLALAIANSAMGQTTTFHDPSGQVTGTARTDANNVTTFYDGANRVTGKARTDANGVTTFYGPSGKVTGKSTPR